MTPIARRSAEAVQLGRELQLQGQLVGSQSRGRKHPELQTVQARGALEVLDRTIVVAYQKLIYLRSLVLRRSAAEAAVGQGQLFQQAVNGDAARLAEFAAQINEAIRQSDRGWQLLLGTPCPPETRSVRPPPVAPIVVPIAIPAAIPAFRASDDPEANAAFLREFE